MNHGYRHTQIGWVTLGALVAGALLVIVIMLTSVIHWISVVVLAILLICSILFASLNIEVTGGYVSWHFGPGFWKKRIAVSDIERVEIVQNRWYYGWGIRYTPHGWLYNVSGLAAVELHLKNGKRIRLGSDEADLLQGAIQQITP